MKTKKILIIFVSKDIAAINNDKIFLGSSYVIDNDVKKANNYPYPYIQYYNFM